VFAKDGDLPALASHTAMKIYGSDDRELMDVTSLTRDGNDLVVRGKIFGSLPLTAKLRPREARAALRMLSLRLALFLITLPFRRQR
jgi:hypothetical protein